MKLKRYISIMAITCALVFSLSITKAYANTPTQVRLTPDEYSDVTELRWYNAAKKSELTMKVMIQVFVDSHCT